MAMDARNSVRSIAVSQDGKWIVAGTQSGLVAVWDENGRESFKFKAHSGLEMLMGDRAVYALDVSSKGRIATGSASIVRVWSMTTRVRLLDLRLPKNFLSRTVHSTVKYSPSGRLLAISRSTDSFLSGDFSDLRVYDSWENGRLLVFIQIHLRSLAWTSDSKQLFSLSHDGNILCLDVYSGETLSEWRIHGNNEHTCIALSRDDRFIAATADSSVSLWDTSTHQQIGSVHHSLHIHTLAFSENHLMIGGRTKITLWPFCPSSPCADNHVGGSALRHLVPSSHLGLLERA